MAVADINDSIKQKRIRTFPALLADFVTHTSACTIPLQVYIACEVKREYISVIQKYLNRQCYKH